MRMLIQAAWVVMALVLLGPATLRAQSDAVISRAQEFLESDSRAKSILFFAHPEAKYQRVNLLEASKVVDGDKKVVPGHFALTYRYAWKSGLSDDNNTTDLVFFFDRGGRFYSLKAEKTTSFFPPFGVADTVVKQLRDEIIKKVDKEGTEADKRLVRALIEDGNARGLLSVLLKLDQP